MRVVALSCCALVACGRIDFEIHEGPCVGMLPNNAPYASGTGTIDDPFLICSPAQLTTLTNRPQDFGASFVLGADLDMTGYPIRGIGSMAAPFTGRFDGASHMIENLEISAVDDHAGLFAHALLARIAHVHLDHVTVTGTKYVGALVGTCDQTQVEDVSATSADIRGDSDVGGLVGQVSYCRWFGATFTGSVTGTQAAIGGIAGTTFVSSFVSIAASVEVNAPMASDVGGVAGLEGNATVTLQNVVVQGTVIGSDAVGGFLGRHADGMRIYRSQFSGSVTGVTSVGGFVGENDDVPFTVASSSVTADVTGTDAVGGMVGTLVDAVSFSDSYFTGTLHGIGANQRAFGGFFGAVDNPSSVDRSYVDVTIESQASSVGGFLGDVSYWSTTQDISNSFAAANVSGASATATISPWIGLNNNQPEPMGTGSYQWSGGTCTNTGGGGCGTGGVAAIADRHAFDDPANPPLSTWNFSGVWSAQAGALPVLDLEQRFAPVTARCAPVAIRNQRYRCSHGGDADPNELPIILLEPDHTCSWLVLVGGRMSGIADASMGATPCKLSYRVTDGKFTSLPETLDLDIWDGVWMTPPSGVDAVFQFPSTTISAVTTQMFTLTNREPEAVSPSIMGLPAGPFQFTGGTFPGTAGTCGSTLAAGASCTVFIDFAPTTRGTSQNDIEIWFTTSRGVGWYPFSLVGVGL